MSDLWLSDVVPGPPDGAPQVVAVTGRTITLAWNAPRSLDMAIGGSSHTGLWVGAGALRGPGEEGKAQEDIQARVGVDGALGAWPGAALWASSPWWTEPWLWVRRGEKGGLPRALLFSEGLGAWVAVPGNPSPSLCTISYCSVPQSPYLR